MAVKWRWASRRGAPHCCDDLPEVVLVPYDVLQPFQPAHGKLDFRGRDLLMLGDLEVGPSASVEGPVLQGVLRCRRAAKERP